MKMQRRPHLNVGGAPRRNLPRLAGLRSAFSIPFPEHTP